MTTIDKLDMNVHQQYAHRSTLVEEIQKEWRVKEATTISLQITQANWQTKPSEMDLLLGAAATYVPWAYFIAPKKFGRLPFATHRIVPSLGSFEEQEEKEERARNTPTSTEEEEKEKKAILNCFGVINKINDWMGHIVGKIGEFLQG